MAPIQQTQQQYQHQQQGRRQLALLTGLLLVGASSGFGFSPSLPLPCRSAPSSTRTRSLFAATRADLATNLVVKEARAKQTAATGSETKEHLPIIALDDDDDDDDDVGYEETTQGPTSVVFDIDEECEGSSCLLSDDAPIDDSPIAKEERISTQNRVDKTLFVIPIIVPLIAYFSYEHVASLSDDIIDLLANKNFVAVDGGAYESKIIAPAINGVVVPSIAILFATLISETITSLRQRQQDIRTTINMEATELRVLQAMVDAFPPGSKVQGRCRSYLIQYTSRLIAESQPGKEDIEEACGGDSEMNGFLATLNAVNDGDLRDALLAESYSAVSRLNSERSQRISSLQSTFPVLHFVILSVLACSIASAFLLETNQDILIFLNAVQLKLLWAMLLGVFSALGTVCYDLVDPFRGSYQISKATVGQLYTIRSALRASAQLSDKEGDDMLGENEF